MPDMKKANRPKLTLAEELQKQGLELREGETALRYRDVVEIANALRNIASKTLPTSEARTHFARCMRAFKPYVHDYNDERVWIQRQHLPPMEVAEEGQTASFVNPLGMSQEYNDFDRSYVAIKLPGKIKSTMLPTKIKELPENEQSIAVWVADLGPLYEIDLDVDPSEPQRKVGE